MTNTNCHRCDAPMVPEDFHYCQRCWDGIIACERKGTADMIAKGAEDVASAIFAEAEAEENEPGS